MKRSKFSLSHYKLFSCDMGELIPCGLLEVLPGDSFQHSTSMLVRCAPLLAPVMHPVHINVYHFYVPHRLVWEDFEDFITGGPDGMDDTIAPYRTFTPGNPNLGSLADYLGVPPNVTTNLNASALPFRGYNMIWNEFFRDQDLQAEANVNVGSGEDTTTSTSLKMANWEKDYFTSARPWEQKGPAITIPVGTTAPVTGIGVTDGMARAAVPANMRQADGTVMTGFSTTPGSWTPGNFGMKVNDAVVGASNPPQIFAKLSAVTGIPVSELRLALSLQRFEEESARYGSRYVEYLMSRFGVRSSDARLQRSELLSRSKQVVQISEVLATAEGTNTDVGDLKGHGIGAMRGNRYLRYFEEHGFVMTLLHVQPRTMYSQGLARLWNRTDKYDYFQVETQHIGQQEILMKEIYAGAASPTATFGWQDRFDEYRRQESRIAGEFRTSTLDFWHQGRIFSSEPALNSTFVRSNPTERIFAVPSQDVLYITARHSIQARRVVAKNATPYIQ